MLSHTQLVSLYRRRAARYDFTANLYYLVGFREWRYRQRAVESLHLQQGDTVVEIGCGTGLNFSLLQDKIGPQGRIIGVDMTDAMLDQARARIEKNGWTNVELVQSDAADFEFPRNVNGIISTFALTLVPQFDDVIRRGANALTKGSRWVVADLKMPSNLFRFLYPLLLPLFRPFGVTLDLAARHPWESIENHLHSTTMQELFLGFTYIASGEK
ncbi:MAG: methyltransferase domain-containing protein [Planctomycetota bacterium]|nr:MAG: methyltransferase domain-containing protein [Planctomycetota bacterium]REJ92145.1 MAG: methyltransferase domain-containing protein [Planctomycetota bacterium]REK28681.1 MAG: methyltransferase domain-containing protein [Planctomycetota bacterium]REK39295.1 MAG: methyltransferase domain-containing protein [Planctomycetota bacterium]